MIIDYQYVQGSLSALRWLILAPNGLTYSWNNFASQVPQKMRISNSWSNICPISSKKLSTESMQYPGRFSASKERNQAHHSTRNNLF